MDHGELVGRWVSWLSVSPARPMTTDEGGYVRAIGFEPSAGRGEFVLLVERTDRRLVHVHAGDCTVSLGMLGVRATNTSSPQGATGEATEIRSD